MRIFGLEILNVKRDYSAHFSPNGGCEDAVVTAIKSAQHSIHAQLFSLTSTPIIGALAEARGRGIDVKIILDKGHVRPVVTNVCAALQQIGVDTLIDMQHHVSNNRVWIIDGKTLLTGSFDATGKSETNYAENLLILRIPALVASYYHNWKLHAKHAIPASLVRPLNNMEKLTYVRDCEPA